MEALRSTFVSGIEGEPGHARVILKGCPLSCDWCSRPESQRFQPELSRDVSKCVQCAHCVDNCTRKAVTANGSVPHLDRARCDECFRCAEECKGGGIRVVGNLLNSRVVFETVQAMAAESVTVSGGEPLSRPDFSREVLQMAKNNGLSTRLETCGFVPWGAFEQVLPVCDTICLEIKAMDDSLHRRISGVTNGLILQNAERLAATDVPLIVRVPLVPGRTDLGDNIYRVIDYARRIGAKNVELFPYSPVGDNMWSCLEKVTPLLQLTARPMSESETRMHLARRAESFSQMVSRIF